jgi:tetratricopeptide repeat protein 21B
MFDRVIQSESSDNLLDIDAHMGKISYMERKNQFWPSQELLNKLIVKNPSFTPALVVKARQLMKVEDWDQAMEITQRILSKDSMNVEAIILSILHLLVKEARYPQAATSVGDLLTALHQREPRNPQLFHHCAQCFSRLSGGNLQFLGMASQLAEHASNLQPSNADYIAEVAFQQLLKGDFKMATQTYKRAATSGEGGTTALLGLIRCLIASGKYVEAAQQIEFPNEIQNPHQRNAELLLLNAMLLWRKEKNQQLSLEKLDQAAEAHKVDVAAHPTGMDLYIKLNPPLMLDIAREYIQHCRTEPPEPGMSKTDPIAEKSRRHLELLLRHVPGSTEAQLLLSKICFVSGDIDKASAMISACIRQDQSLPEAYLLSAQIHQYNGSVSLANQALEQALTLDFEIKDQPHYNLLRGTVLGMMNELQEALITLQHALKLVQNPQQATSRGRPIKLLSVQDHVSLYLQLAQTYLRLKNTDDARSTVAEAARLFSDTTQMGRVLIAQAMIVARTDVDKAVEILRQVPPKSEFFLSAKARMANLYLVQRQNRHAFARCYEELVESFPFVQSYICLGEAYSSIQEPEKAITAFEKARAMDPNNADLAVRIGRALATTHDYHRALRYYRDAVAADGAKFNLRQDLATLYWRLGEVDKAITVLRDCPAFAKNITPQEDTSTSVERVNATLMMCKIYRSSGDHKSAIEALIQARVFQNNVLNKLRGETSETVYQQRSIAANICLELGQYYQQQQVPEKALTFFNEALKHDETSEKAMLALARLYLSRGEIDGCEQQCNAQLRVNPSCEDAIMILADLMYRKNRFDDAAHHFVQLLEKKPENFTAMVRYVQLLRRAGRLEDALPVFESAEKLVRPGQKPDPGFSFAKGLYHRYTNSSAEALKHFNNGRFPKDNPWSQMSIVNMIEVYIMPDGENLWEDSENRESTSDNIRTAEKLLAEVSDPEKRAVLEGYCLIASKRQANLEKAVNKFFEIVSATDAKLEPEKSASQGDEEGVAVSDKINVPALVGLATALQLLKQTPKARNHLKRVAKVEFRGENDDSFERGWLLLADIYIQSGKYDLAQELLKKAIQANKSCSRAWEYMGLIFEKEQSYNDAADCYDNAWKLAKQADPGIGYKLAFNYLKARKYVNCIDICHQVLSAHPSYPKIRKDVLERARSMLRP